MTLHSIVEVLARMVVDASVCAVIVRRTGSVCAIEPVLREYHRAVDGIGICKPPQILLSDQVMVPALVGIRRPAVVLPAELTLGLELPCHSDSNSQEDPRPQS